MALAALKPADAAGTVPHTHACDPLAARRRALRIGKDILGLLEDLQKSVRAAAAAEAVDDLGALDDAGTSLKNVLGEIQLRAHSELAKLDRLRH
jgi:hypothetical protein